MKTKQIVLVAIDDHVLNLFIHGLYTKFFYIKVYLNSLNNTLRINKHLLRVKK